ncbi:MAG: hypothetical protein K6F31_03935 [Acetatifactor sp.]|nr:hypothetical protein [Acetatifactor sp.]
MNDKELDEILKESLRPEMQADAALDQEILEKVEAGVEVPANIRKMGCKRKWHTLPKVAAIALAVLALGAGTTYAANRLMKKPVIAEHAIVLSQDPKDEEYYEYLNDSNNMQPVDSSKTLVSKEEPGPSDRWISKKTYREEVFGEWPTTAIFKEYYYDDYVKATVDWNFTDLLGEKLKDAKPAEIVYHEYWTEEPAEWSGLKFTNINSEFSYKKGIVKIYQSISTDGTGEVFRMLTDKGRVLTYVSKSGNEYTLVENASWMLVDFMLGEEMVQLEFYNLSDQQIYDFLDKLNLQ